MATYRASMAGLLTKLRGMTAAGIDDYELAGDTFWTDLQLIERLDAERKQLRGVTLDAEPERVGSVYEYHDYRIPKWAGQWFEEAGTGSGFVLRDASGNEISSGFIVNYEAREIRFTADQAGVSYFLDIRAYNLFAVAARIWREKAGHVADAVNWSSDNHRIDAGSEQEHCLKMAAEMQKKAANGGGLGSGTFVRVDETRLR